MVYPRAKSVKPSRGRSPVDNPGGAAYRGGGNSRLQETSAMARFWLVCLLAALSGACAPDGAKRDFPHAIMTPEPRKPVPAVSLAAADGTTLQTSALKHQWTWVYFG